MTHEELRALLPRYAAGETEPEGERAIRAHLASGCSECLQELFRHPVGRPISRTVDEVETGRLAGASRARGRSGGRLATAVVLGLGLGLAALMTWTISDLRRREASARLEAAGAAQRLAERAAEVAAQEARVAGLERELSAARDQLARMDGAAETATRLRDALEAAEQRVAALVREVGRRDAELDRLRMSAAERHTVRELLATPGIEVLPLAAVPPYRDVRGHVLWHPARPVVVLYAFGLPPLPAGGEYRVRLRLDDGAALTAAVVRPGPDGEVALPLRLDTVGAKLREVTLVRGPQEQAVLAGQAPR